MSFQERLAKAIQTNSFDVPAARQLSKELHDAEKCGYKMSAIEDALWLTMTRRIMQEDK